MNFDLNVQKLHSPAAVPISLAEVVQHFRNTAPPKRKLQLGVGQGPGGKKAKTGDNETEDSESDSSLGE